MVKGTPADVDGGGLSIPDAISSGTTATTEVKRTRVPAEDSRAGDRPLLATVQ